MQRTLLVLRKNKQGGVFSMFLDLKGSERKVAHAHCHDEGVLRKSAVLTYMCNARRDNRIVTFVSLRRLVTSIRKAIQETKLDQLQLHILEEIVRGMPEDRRL
jgi:hypothetical protein